MPAEPSSSPDWKIQTFLGVPFACLDVHGTAQVIAARSPTAPFAYIITSNASHLVRLNELKDARFIATLKDAWLHTLDGSVPHWLSRKLFGLNIPLCPGSDLTAELFEHVIQPDDAITIIGGSEEMKRRLVERYGLRTVHLHVPPMGFIDDPDAVEAAIDFVVTHPARYVFLVVGAPRSEYLAHLIYQRGSAVGIGLCVGSSLNFLTGLVQRASPAFRRLGLEWLYRLIQSPSTHIQRVFVDSMPVFITAAKAKMNPKAYGMDGPRSGGP
ncbi:exopolysaccharide biosynthesis WecB/TagA/CpsF family protein [Xanthobacter flavus]|uniref:Exopolysaccharide biosynthesis WecB/TagA/CpsF family protein n=1 Tax=Xanthobacter flavus TaxID=281 RepID=A0A9W6CLB6_XANFL|nr:WecB/TagA/CpsF family glycosyltransferase [Xanthobacter flavus]MDR6335697.1 exopolysaccharide biosynthesis WecB/TagA/CpsF family protein [Xanthobacter flavus]GLI24626.1 glycosyl transferase [Xanthobacter flavus]